MWTGALSSGIYASLRVGAATVKVHRYIYEEFVDQIPETMQIDHLCRQTRCINPDHLEVVTNTENQGRAAKAKTHCRRGHAYS